jgi:hypothetical protein
MDRAGFEIWFAGNGALSEPQRRRTWQALALSEAADSGASRRIVGWTRALRRQAHRRKRNQQTGLPRPVSRSLGNVGWTALVAARSTP